MSANPEFQSTQAEQNRLLEEQKENPPVTGDKTAVPAATVLLADLASDVNSVAPNMMTGFISTNDGSSATPPCMRRLTLLFKPHVVAAEATGHARYLARYPTSCLRSGRPSDASFFVVPFLQLLPSHLQQQAALDCHWLTNGRQLTLWVAYIVQIRYGCCHTQSSFGRKVRRRFICRFIMCREPYRTNPPFGKRSRVAWVWRCSESLFLVAHHQPTTKCTMNEYSLLYTDYTFLHLFLFYF